MTDEIKYYPLIDMSADGTEKMAMFPTTDKNVIAEKHKLWLSERIPGCFRLCANKVPPIEAVKSFNIYCPRCGKAMHAVTFVSETSRMPLYLCDNC